MSKTPQIVLGALCFILLVIMLVIAILYGVEYNCPEPVIIHTMTHFPAIRSVRREATLLDTGADANYMKTIAYSLVAGKEMQGGVLRLKKGGSLDYNQWFEGFVFILEGEFDLSDSAPNSTSQAGVPGDSFYIPRGASIKIEGTSDDSRLYYVMQPPGFENAQKIEEASNTNPSVQRKTNYKVMSLPLFVNEEGSLSYLEDTIFSTIKGRGLTGGFYELKAGPALHYTYDYEEFKYIVEGEFHLKDGTGKKVVAKAGDLMYFPIGVAVEFTSPDRGLGFFVGQRGMGEAK